MQERRDAGKEGCRREGMHERRDAGYERCRIGGMRTGGMKDRWDAG